MEWMRFDSLGGTFDRIDCACELESVLRDEDSFW
jgi:hypothetical protein